MNIADVQSVIASAVGGENIGETVEGLQRFPINVRYPREIRDSLEKLRSAADRHRARRAARAVATWPTSASADGPPMLRSENARLSGWVYVDIRGRDLRSAVQRHAARGRARGEAAAGLLDLLVGPVRVPGARHREAEGRRAVHAADHLRAAVPHLPALRRGAADHGGAAVRAGRRHLAAVPARPQPVGRRRGRLHRARRRRRRVRRDHAAVPEAGVGRAARRRHERAKNDLLDAIREGAVLRVRPKAMTVAVILAGLLPIMWGGGTGSEVMQRIAAPMVGGMITAPLLSMFVIPAAYLLMRRGSLRRARAAVRFTLCATRCSALIRQRAHQALELGPGQRRPDLRVGATVAAHEHRNTRRVLDAGRLENIDVITRSEHRVAGDPAHLRTLLADLFGDIAAERFERLRL